MLEEFDVVYSEQEKQAIMLKLQQEAEMDSLEQLDAEDQELVAQLKANRARRRELEQLAAEAAELEAELKRQETAKAVAELKGHKNGTKS